MMRLRTIMILVVIIQLTFLNTAAGRLLIDKKGREISLYKPYKRIISLYSAHTENLFHLAAANQIIGVSVNDTFPAEALTKQKFSYHDGPEKYLAARPDLILIRPMIDNGYPQFVKQLESYGITIVSLQPATISEMYDYWIALGNLTGNRAQAAAMVAEFQRQVSNISGFTRNISHRKRVYFQAIHKRMKTFTPGSMTIYALQTAGGINIAGDAVASRNTNVAIYSKEKILSKANEIDVILAQKGIMNPVNKSEILNEPGFQIIKAVKEKQIYLIDESFVSRPVFRLLDGIKAIGHILYPELFLQLTENEGTL